jgi:hypothetical protein
MKPAPRQFVRPLFLAALLLHAMHGCSRPTFNALRVGMGLAYFPFESIDEQGRPSGVSVDRGLKNQKQPYSAMHVAFPFK